MQKGQVPSGKEFRTTGADAGSSLEYRFFSQASYSLSCTHMLGLRNERKPQLHSSAPITMIISVTTVDTQTPACLYHANMQ